VKILLTEILIGKKLSKTKVSYYKISRNKFKLCFVCNCDSWVCDEKCAFHNFWVKLQK